MSYASQSGRARTSATHPEAHAICDRCGARYNMVDLRYQYDWRGVALQNLQILVCKDCYDTPQEQLRAIVVPADPTPIKNARVQDFTLASSDYRALSPQPVDPVTGINLPNTNLRITNDDQNRVTNPYGEPKGLSQTAVMPNVGKLQYGVVLPVLSVSSTDCLVTVTCSAVHNLQPNAQISVEGFTAGNGFYSVQVPTATSFIYQTEEPCNPQLTAAVRIVTVLVGLPRGFTDFPMPAGRNNVTPYPTAPGVPTGVIAIPD